jgi:hypothetical protein
MSYTSPESPVVLFVGEQAIGNAVHLAKYQWPALFNYASGAFFESEWFLKKTDGQPYQPRLIVPICASPAVLEKAATNPHYLAYPLPDLPLPDWGSATVSPTGKAAGKPIPICAQVDDLLIDFAPLTSDLPPDWKPEEGQFFVRLTGFLGMLAESPGLPTIPETPLLLLKFPLDLKALVSACLLRGGDGIAHPDVRLVNLDPLAFEPLPLKQMLVSLSSLVASRFVSEALAQIACPIQVAAGRLSTLPADRTAPSDIPYHITFDQPVQIVMRLDTREAGLRNPEMKEDRLGVYFELDCTREATP